MAFLVNLTFTMQRPVMLGDRHGIFSFLTRVPSKGGGGCGCGEGTTCWINPHSTWWSPCLGTHSLALYVHHRPLIAVASASYLYTAIFHSHLHGSNHDLS